MAEFEYDEDNSEVIACPDGHSPKSPTLSESGTLTAYFDCTTFESCPNLERCRIQLQKKTAVLRVNQSAIVSSQARQEIYEPENRKSNLSVRAGIEGIGSALIRAEGARGNNIFYKIKYIF